MDTHLKYFHVKIENQRTQHLMQPENGQRSHMLVKKPELLQNSSYSLIAAYVSSSLILCDFIGMYDRIPITSFWLHAKNCHVAGNCFRSGSTSTYV
jgi:hypothetical protein